ncbi:MAG: MBL fold metallo-hydrolase [Acidobacteria bacterium]|nr:MBL fold metallo-hydrolase [Acidobacteriota bacterium]
MLGTGTSHGVPMIGCACATCHSADPRDRRTRPSILIERVGQPEDDRGVRSILVDTSTDLRMQALTHGVRRVDAILFTHSHADHIFGLDEVRRFNAIQDAAIPAYADERTARDLRRAFAYIFDPHTPQGGGIPQISLSTIGGPFCLGRCEVVPVPVLHGKRPILGYRVGPFAYLTDCSAIPDASWPLLTGVRTLVLDALRHRPHPTHFSVAEAIDAAARIGAERTLFTHICHDLPHAATCAALPPGVELAYDGQVIEVPTSGV